MCRIASEVAVKSPTRLISCPVLFHLLEPTASLPCSVHHSVRLHMPGLRPRSEAKVEDAQNHAALPSVPVLSAA